MVCLVLPHGAFVQQPQQQLPQPQRRRSSHAAAVVPAPKPPPLPEKRGKFSNATASPAPTSPSPSLTDASSGSRSSSRAGSPPVDLFAVSSPSAMQAALFSQQGSLGARDADGWMLLHVLAWHRRADLLQVVVAHPVVRGRLAEYVQATGLFGLTPLHNAWCVHSLCPVLSCVCFFCCRTCRRRFS
jgi:hypothetical protein